MIDDRKHCPTCPVGLVCMAGRLKIRWRCAECAKLLVETVPEDPCNKKAETQLVLCAADLPIPERESILPRLCSKCYVIDRQRDDKQHWMES